MICRDCGLEFEIKHTKKGFINQCDDCATDVPLYMGNIADGETIIIKSNIETVKAFLKEETKGFQEFSNSERYDNEKDSDLAIFIEDEHDYYEGILIPEDKIPEDDLMKL